MTQEEIDSEETFNKNALELQAWYVDKIVDIQQCHLQVEPSNKIQVIRRYALEKFSIFSIMIKVGFENLNDHTTSTGEVMVLIQFVHESDRAQSAIDSPKNTFPQITALLYVINNKTNDTLYDQDINYLLVEIISLKKWKTTIQNRGQNILSNQL